MLRPTCELSVRVYMAGIYVILSTVYNHICLIVGDKVIGIN